MYANKNDPEPVDRLASHSASFSLSLRARAINRRGARPADSTCAYTGLIRALEYSCMLVSRAPCPVSRVPWPCGRVDEATEPQQEKTEVCTSRGKKIYPRIRTPRHRNEERERGA